MRKATRGPSNFPGQHEGEIVLMVIHQHPLVMRKALIYGLVAILLAVIPLDFVYDGPFYSSLVKLAIGTPVVVLALWFYRWISWYYTMFIVTDSRILDIRQKGFFNRRVNEYQLNKVLNINYHIKGFQAVLFAYGDINVEMITSQTLKLTTIHRPVKVHGELVEIYRQFGTQPRHFSE